MPWVWLNTLRYLKRERHRLDLGLASLTPSIRKQLKQIDELDLHCLDLNRDDDWEGIPAN